MLASFLVPTAARADVANLNPSKDNALIENATGGVSNGAGSWFMAGKTNEGTSGKIRRALIQFDLSAIPTNAVVSAVSLVLTNDRGKGSGYNIELHRALASWGEGTSNSDADPGKGAPSTPNDATWIHRFYSSQNWATAGGDFAATASATVLVGNSGAYTWTSAQMVSDVQQWVSNPATNFGWLLKGVETQKQTTRRFKSGNNASGKPVLQVTYTVATITGACCLPDNSCQVLTPAQCSIAGGAYQGDGTVCTPNPCVAPTGACCFDNGSCTTETQAQCTAAGGTYQGDGTSCSPNPCPVVLTPFVDALPLPAVATPTSGTAGGTASYTLPITEFTQQLHRDLPATRVWGYAGSFPGPTIEATPDHPVTVTWINDLRDASGTLRTRHVLPVDLCLKGPDVYGSAPRTVSHLHGGHVPAAVDGYPENTILPGQQAMYVYPNHQAAATLWYHDHAMGITRLNVMMGLAGFYLLRDSIESAVPLPSAAFEIPLAIQDRTFNPDGSIQYGAPPDTLWHEHFFGDKVLVNGKVWPYLNVKKGKYRFRILDGSNSRVYVLTLSNGAPFWVIGTEGGLLPAPVQRTSLTITPGERVDVVIDFQPYTSGTEIVLQNSAPAPYPGSPGVGVIPNVMKFIVTSGGGAYTSPLPATLRAFTPLDEGTAYRTRSFTLSKVADACSGQKWTINQLPWETITENPYLNTTEIWTFINRSGFVHPMHMHLVQFQVLDRQPFTIVADTVQATGPRVPPDSTERGWKDTAPVGPFDMMRVIARFDDYKGKYAYHCHILEHEDQEMMRQFEVVDAPAAVLPSLLEDLRVDAAYPNPSSDAAHLQFVLPQAARTQVVVEDVAGRRLTTLMDGPLNAGRHVVAWNGRGASMEKAPPGVYFYRVLVDGRPVGSRKFVLLR